MFFVRKTEFGHGHDGIIAIFSPKEPTEALAYIRSQDFQSVGGTILKGSHDCPLGIQLSSSGNDTSDLIQSACRFDAENLRSVARILDIIKIEMPVTHSDGLLLADFF